MAAAIDPPETASTPAVEEISGRGHIGLVVLGSIAFGLILGLVLVLGVFGGGRENVITGAALVSFALGMLMLFGLARRRTDQPQPWALAPAVGLGSLASHSSSLGRAVACWVGSAGCGRFCSPHLSCGRGAVRTARFTTGRGELFSTQPSSSWDWSRSEEHTRPSPRRRRVTRPRLVVPTSSAVTVSM